MKRCEGAVEAAEQLLSENHSLMAVKKQCPEKSSSATGGQTGTAALSVFMYSMYTYYHSLPPPILLQVHHQSVLDKRKPLQTLQQSDLDFHIPLVSVLLCI